MRWIRYIGVHYLSILVLEIVFVPSVTSHSCFPPCPLCTSLISIEHTARTCVFVCVCVFCARSLQLNNYATKGENLKAIMFIHWAFMSLILNRFIVYQTSHCTVHTVWERKNERSTSSHKQPSRYIDVYTICSIVINALFVQLIYADCWCSSIHYLSTLPSVKPLTSTPHPT